MDNNVVCTIGLGLFLALCFLIGIAPFILKGWIDSKQELFEEKK